MSESNDIDKFDYGKLNACLIFINIAELIDNPEYQKKIKVTFYPVLPSSTLLGVDFLSLFIGSIAGLGSIYLQFKDDKPEVLDKVTQEFLRKMGETVESELSKIKQEQTQERIKSIISLMQGKMTIDSFILLNEMKHNEEVRKTVKNVCRNVGVYTLEV